MTLEWVWARHGGHVCYAAPIFGSRTTGDGRTHRHVAVAWAYVQWDEAARLWRARVKARPGDSLPLAGSARGTAELAKRWCEEWAERRSAAA